jgi:ribonucleotide reductase beta subunit family protein with ferritin-like domain
MEMISLEQKTNFFESRVSEYSLAEKSGKEDAFDDALEF